MQEQEAESQRQRQHHADRHVPLGELLAEQAHADAGHDRKADEAGEGREAEQDRARRAGEADMGERVAGEGLAAQDEEEADRSGEHGRNARGREGGAHEVIFKHGRRRGRAHARARRRGDARRARRRRRPPSRNSGPSPRTTSISAP